MELFTSYWNSPLLADVQAVKVSTSRGDPRRAMPFSYRKLWSLCPSREAFGLKDDDAFERSYLGGLNALGVSRVTADLRRIASEHGGASLILLCHEKDPAACHRSLLAGWLERQTGIVVPELQAGDLPEITEVSQQRLFQEG